VTKAEIDTLLTLTRCGGLTAPERFRGRVSAGGD